MALSAGLTAVVAAFAFMSHQTHARPQRQAGGLLQHKLKDDSEEEVHSIEKDRDLHGVVLKLNDRIFDGNVIQQTDYSTDHWMVYWCPNWFEPCNALIEKYAPLSTQWQGKLNKQSLLRLSVRFAKVDCATDKPLCNKMGVEDYPTVQHYHKGNLVGTFVGRRSQNVQKDGSKLAAWLEEELSGIQQEQQQLDATTPNPVQFIVPGDRALDVFLVILLISVNFWVVARNSNLRQKPSPIVSTACCSPASSPCVSASEHEATQNDEDKEAESLSGIESLMPQDWLRQRNANISMEL